MSTSNKKIKAEDFVKLKFAELPDFSPNGDLVFTIRTVNENKNTYKGSLFVKRNNATEIIRFTSGTHLDTRAKVSPSSDIIAFLSSRSEKGMQLHIMNVMGGESIQITNLPKGVIDFSWSHDSRSILIMARVNEQELEIIKKQESPKSYILDPVAFQMETTRKNESEIFTRDPRVITDGYYRDGTNYLEGRTTQPFVINLDKTVFNDPSYTIPHPIHIGDISYHFTLGVFSSDNRRVILSKYSDDPSLTLDQDILNIDLLNPSEKVKLGEAYGGVTNFQLSPNGKLCSYNSIRKEVSIYDDQQIHVFNSDPEGPFNHESITESYHRSATFSKWFDDETLLFLSPNEGKISIKSIDKDTKLVEDIIGGDRLINSFTVSPNKGKIAYEVSHAEYPSDIFEFDLISGTEVQITKVNEKYLATHPPASYEVFTYMRDGFNFQGWMFYPPNISSDAKIPVVLEIHGGPAAMWSPHEKTLWHEWNSIVNTGNAVVFCNPRGSDGYGIEFRSAVHKNWGDLAANDILKALDTALELYPYLDSERQSVTGGSYGGYMTAWLITQTDRFKAAISQRGVYEFVGFGLTTDIPKWFELQYGEILTHYGENWDDGPMAHVEKVTTPLLIIHSENDYRVPIISAEILFWLGKRYGKEIELVRYPRDGHELSRSGEPRHIIDRINRIINWIKKYSN
ncbi:MAG: S9 family peptidase [Candidatus Hodarchaeales archaeon]|jgi:dipeptidyl aminopeptidase/acylaminoacyl peptidase